MQIYFGKSDFLIIFDKIFFMIIEMSQQQYAAFLGISEGEMSKRITRSEPLAGFLSVKQFGRFRVFTVDNEAIVRRSKKRSKKLAK